MKKYINEILLGVLCVIGLNACDITEYPYDSITDDELISNPSSVELATLGNYSYMKESQFHKSIHFNGEFGSDNVLYSGTSTSPTFYIYNYQRVPANSDLTNLWTYSYKVIVNCNKVISMAQEGISKEMDHLIGENYFIRAFCYHQLAIAHGKDYHIANDTDPAVPLKLTADPNDCPPRATVKAVYKQIVDDLKKAEQLMTGAKEKNACYANLWAVKAMLSRVYLFMHDYEKSEKYATDVINNSKKTLLTNSQYRTMNELVPEANPEALFAIRMLKDIDYSKSRSASMYTIIDGDGWGEVYASLPLLEAFEKYPTDVRSVFIVPQYEPLTKDGEQLEELWFTSENFFYKGNENPARDPLHRRYFRFQQVKKEGSNYKIIVDPQKDFFEFETPEVQVRFDGTYYVKARQVYRDKENEVIGRAEWVEYTVKIQNKMKKRNDYPRYYINKIAYQEQQQLLYSPMLLRLSEMYLNRAEARYYQAKQADAISDLNIIKARAGIPLYNEAVDGELLDAILDEARKEFYVEAHRRYDLFRNDKVLDRHYPGCHDRGAESVVVQEVRVTDNCAIQYLPQTEIDAYPIPLEQNP